MSKIVIALGGNALGNTPEEQLLRLKNVAKIVVDLVKKGNKIVLTHGNGPQVGQIALAMEYSANGAGTPDMPFPECGSMSQGYIGYQLQQCIQNELNNQDINETCATVITQVLVDPADTAFQNPTKPIGSFYSKEEAMKISSEKGYEFVEDAGRGYRRVVPSPKPIDIVEKDVIELLANNAIVIASGGGGIPVTDSDSSLSGVDAVIDKDRTASLLGKLIGADTLLILTAVDKVSINYGKENQVDLDRMTVRSAKRYIKAGHFAKGSMLPKVEAAIDFVKDSNRIAIISSLENAGDAINGKNGTIIEGGLKMTKKKAKVMLSSFSIILILIFGLGILSHVLPNAKFVGDTIVNGSGTVGATLSQILMAPIKGFEDAIDVAIFIMMLGGLLAVVNKTGALETGIKVLVHKLKGRETLLIPILMFVFSICGTTYGMLEETVGFYVLLAATMMAAGMDPLVGSAVVLLGAGSGCLGSTINPFATGAAIAALPEGIASNQGLVILIGVVLWLTTLFISIMFVMKYAKKVQKDKGSTFLSLREQKAAEKSYGRFAEKNNEEVSLTGKQKVTLVLFGLTFLVMIIGFVPWGEFGITFFDGFTGWLTGSSLGNWWFYEAALWFLIMAIIIAIVNRTGEKGFVDSFVDGADDMIGVILVIAIARGASVLMRETYLDNYIIYNAANLLSKLPEIAFVPLNYILHVILSILVPSSSGLASLSTPIIAPLASTLGYNVEVSVMSMVAANGLVNLITPTCGAIMGGLALAKVEYSTWFRWALKVVLTIALVNIVVLCLFAIL